MKAVDFKATEETVGAFYLTGDDGYWRDKALGEFRSLVPEYARDLDLKSAYPFRSPEDLEEAVTSFSPFGGKVVVLAGGYGTSGKGEGESKAAAAAWAKLLDELGEGAALVVYDSKLPQQAAKRMTEIDCSRLDAQTLKTYISALVKPRKIDFRALNMLVEYTNRDMARIANELAKLEAYCKGGDITAEAVDALVADTQENAVYEFSGALAERNRARATELMSRFIADGVPYPVLLSLLINQYRRLLHCSLSPKASDAELSEALGIKEYAVRRSRESARKYSQSALKKILTLLVNAEYSFKSGEMSDATAFRTAVAEITAM